MKEQTKLESDISVAKDYLVAVDTYVYFDRAFEEQGIRACRACIRELQKLMAWRDRVEKNEGVS